MLKIALIGDTGHTSLIQEIIFKRIREQMFDKVFLLGDNFYPDGVSNMDDQQWSYKVFQYFSECPDAYVMAILGNHDYHQNPMSQVMMTFRQPIWHMPFLYYDHFFKEHDLHCFFIDANLLAPIQTRRLIGSCMRGDVAFQNLYAAFAENQLQWIHHVLSTCNARWKFMCGHYPVFSNGPHSVSQEMTQVHELCHQYNIDAYFSGHDHNVQIMEDRGIVFAITGSGSTFTPPVKMTCPYTRFVSDCAGFLSIEMTLNSMDLYFHGIESESGPVLVFQKLKL